jgi:flavin reductase (DIM6/NTAB) family NADH-FMN oxidoreductase RutF
MQVKASWLRNKSTGIPYPTMKSVDPSDAFAMFKPESVVFVISSGKDGRPSGMAAAWVTRCSMQPPMLAVSVGKSRYTHKLIRESKEFVIAVPNKELEKELLYFGSASGSKVDKFKATGIETEAAKVVKPPLIKRATINFECVLEKEVEAGDHTLFIGRVVAAHVNKGKKIMMSMGRIAFRRVFKEF